MAAMVNCDDAIRFIERIQDPVTRNLVNMAFVHLVKKVHLEKGDRPTTDLDMLFLVTSLKDFFEEHQVLAAALDGENVGAWFEEEAGTNGSPITVAAVGPASKRSS